MEQQAILAFGAITLTMCGVGLLFVHSSNPLLKGLNWMGRALVIGGVAAALLLAGTRMDAFQPLGNLGILLAFLCCYRADQYLLCQEAPPTGLGIVLVAVEAAMAPAQWMHLAGTRAPVVVLSAVLALQIEATARLLYRTADAGGRLPARFAAGLMRVLVAANVARGVAAASGWLDDPARANVADTVTYAVFIGVGVCLGFAFFWRTTVKLTSELEQMAGTDPLTRVFNRRVFLAWCEKELERSRESNLPVSVLFVDFDHFKRINDSFGHHIGDEVLCAAVERMQDSIRGIDVLCRWGGEEFALLLPNAGPEATLIVAERMRQNIRLVNTRAERFARQVSGEFQLTASIGAATFARGMDTIEGMLQRADAAMYEAKSAGRDRVVISAKPSHELQPSVEAAPGLMPGLVVKTL